MRQVAEEGPNRRALLRTESRPLRVVRSRTSDVASPRMLSLAGPAEEPGICTSTPLPTEVADGTGRRLVTILMRRRSDR